MSLPPLNENVVRETTFSSDPVSRICVHELALAIARVIYDEDALVYADASLNAREDAHALIQEMADLPRCQMKGGHGVAD